MEGRRVVKVKKGKKRTSVATRWESLTMAGLMDISSTDSAARSSGLFAMNVNSKGTHCRISESHPTTGWNDIAVALLPESALLPVQ